MTLYSAVDVPPSSIIFPKIFYVQELPVLFPKRITLLFNKNWRRKRMLLLDTTSIRMTKNFFPDCLCLRYGKSSAEKAQPQTRREPLDWKIYCATRPQDAFKPCIRLAKSYLWRPTTYEHVVSIAKKMKTEFGIPDSDFIALTKPASWWELFALEWW